MQWFTRILIGIGTMIAGLMGLLMLSKNETLGERLKQHYEESLEAGREAAAEKRNQLEIDLAKMMLSDNEKK